MSLVQLLRQWLWWVLLWAPSIGRDLLARRVVTAPRRLCKILMLLCQRSGHFLGECAGQAICMRAMLQATAIRYVGQGIVLEGKVIIPCQFLLAVQRYLGRVRVRLSLLMACNVWIWAGEALDLICLTLILGLGWLLVLGVVLGLVRCEPIILQVVTFLGLPLVGWGN